MPSGVYCALAPERCSVILSLILLCEGRLGSHSWADNREIVQVLTDTKIIKKNIWSQVNPIGYLKVLHDGKVTDVSPERITFKVP